MADQARYEAAEAVAIVTYSTVFNSSPKLAAADLLVLDDAHAANSTSPSSRRSTSVGGSSRHLRCDRDGVVPGAGRMLVQRLRDPNPDPSAHQQVRLVAPLRQPGVVDALDAALADFRRHTASGTR